ncbi:hypothetical protein D9758_005805 [Tetrapyrgos nigripes]|uniref:RRM domain-containing protein n=1 Tax=Tetrapyrgos nigripes TaxID=182062 RepID=A0A8H5GK61_9AGAR|nr:hypothetical protein D9758_005805 [Tetrapyrgos nigripes]
MSFLHPPACSSHLTLLPRSTTARCMKFFLRSMASEAVTSEATTSWKNKPLTRCVRVKNLPPTFTVTKLLRLKGMSRPIESVYRLPDHNEVEIHYLQPCGATRAVRAASEGNLVIDGQELEVRLCEPQRFPVEIVAGIVLKSASRVLWLRPPEQFKTVMALEEVMKRFGEVEDIWIDESGAKAKVTFSRIGMAMEAWKSLRSDEAWADSNVTFHIEHLQIFPREDNSTTAGQHRTVYLSHLPLDLDPHQLMKSVEDMIVWRHSEPILSFSMCNNTAFFHFKDSVSAQIFYDAYEPLGGIQKGWSHQDGPPAVSQLTAANLGASRQLSMIGLDVTRIDSRRLRWDFSEFGGVVRAHVDKRNCTALITFADILHACKAIDHIHENPSDFSLYKGAKIMFWHRERPKVGQTTRSLFYLRPMRIGGPLPATESEIVEDPIPLAISSSEDRELDELVPST